MRNESEEKLIAETCTHLRDKITSIVRLTTIKGHQTPGPRINQANFRIKAIFVTFARGPIAKAQTAQISRSMKCQKRTPSIKDDENS